MNINIIGQKIEPETPYLRKKTEQPKEEVVRFVLFALGVVLGTIITFIVKGGVN